MSASRLTSFHRFPDLPAELQDMVWQFAIPSPPERVDVRLVTSGPQTTLRVSRLPSVFHACRGSRREAFRHASPRREYVTPGYKVSEAEALPSWHSARHCHETLFSSAPPFSRAYY
jgi:hypothetical protein